MTITDEMRRAAPDAYYACEICAEYPEDAPLLLASELHWHPRNEVFYCENCHEAESPDDAPRWDQCPTLAQVLRTP